MISKIKKVFLSIKKLLIFIVNKFKQNPEKISKKKKEDNTNYPIW